MRMPEKKPLVSIGMPLYNEERYLRQMLDSLILQDYENFELIISDNASSDSTPQICQEYAAKDARVRYHRNETNIGASANFKKVFQLSQGDYFAWVAGHDLWDSTFLSRCLELLLQDESVVLCHPQAMWIDTDGQPLGVIPSSVETRGLDRISRFHVVLWGLGYCSPVYGLMCSKALRQVNLGLEVVAPDAILLAELSLLGAFAHISEPLLYMRKMEDYGSWEKYIEKIFRQSLSNLSAPSMYWQMIDEHLKVVSKHINSSLEKDAATLSTVLCLLTKYSWILNGLENSKGQNPSSSSSFEERIKQINSQFSESTKAIELLFNHSDSSIFNKSEKSNISEKEIPKILIDGVFFQLYRTGIARVWQSLLEEWTESGFAKHIVVLDRVGTAPKIPGIAYCPVPAYDYEKTDSDREMLQQVCDELEADLFISTYYTTPLSTPSVFIAYDMTPEVFETNLDEPMWREKHYGIRHASAYITISQNTASDLLKFFPDLALELVTVAHCGVPKNFSPASPEEIENFKIKYNLSKPYFMMVGAAGGHKNAPLFLQAFAQLPNQPEFDIVCTAHSALTQNEFEPYTAGSTVHKLPLSDEELKAAFSGAVALVYPSQYEGFGLPILEAMACGCPVITCPNASIPEVAGEAALYVKDDDVEAMAIALTDIQKPEVREGLITAGIEQAKKFSWSKMAKTVSEVLIEVFQETENMSVIQESFKKTLPERDYISPNLAIVKPDECFPNIIVGDPRLQPWPYLRREVPHNWYVDKRHPTVGFLSRDEAHILYNTALKFKGKKALEIGCWLGWSACHLALAGVDLDVVDPLLARPDFFESVSNSLQAAGVLESVNLVAGYSPQAVEELAAQLQTKWSLIFIDGNHEAPGPLNDAIICEQLAAEDALIVFHDLAAPDVAQGLDYFKQKGWHTLVYQTMQIMGVAWRGNVEPVIHQPDPKVNWVLPAHLQSYKVSGMSNNQSVDRELAVRQVQEMMQQAVALLNSNKPVEAMRLAEQAASLNINVPGMHYLRCVCLNNVGRHKEALAAAKAELAIDPTHRQAQEQVESLTKAILRSPIKIPTQQRSWNTTLARENMLSIQNASMNYSYRGVPMIKNPFDFAVYPLLLWNLKPRTIIEIGSKDGGSALWFGDQLNNFGIDGHVYSIDIVEVTSVQHPRVTYMEGNGRALQEILTPDFINSLPRPLLVIEDADHTYETSKHVLEFFHPYLKREEYIVIEDGIISDLVQDASYNIGPHKALKEFLSEHEDEYEIDSSYCDYFGYNMTWCTNGFLKKVQESSSFSQAFLDKKTVITSEISLSEELSEFLDNLSLREINIILFPDWEQPEADLCFELELFCKTLLAHPDRNKITALLDTTNIPEEDANLIISSVVMNILLQEDLEETKVPEIALLGKLSESQWAALIPHIQYRLALEHENQQKILQVGAEKLPLITN